MNDNPQNTKILDSMIRLRILSLLISENDQSFSNLKIKLVLEDSKLSGQMKLLEKSGFVYVKKQFIERKPNTSYYITLTGSNAFLNHIKTLDEIINIHIKR